MTPIRPNPYPVQPSPTAAGEPARQAAQRAFFDAAMGRTAAPSPAQPPVFAPSPGPVQHAEVRPVAAAEPPAKLLRPGSLLDIRV